MITCSKTKNAATRDIENANLNSVSNVKKLVSVSLETVWASIVGWSAGLAGPAPLALLRERNQ